MNFRSSYEAPWTDPGTLPEIDVARWRHHKPVTKAAKCCHCGLCYVFCPTGCMIEVGGHFDALPARCKGCGICAAVCPVDAIAMVPEIP